MICEKALKRREEIIEAEIEKQKIYNLIFEYGICPECGGDIYEEHNIIPLPEITSIMQRIFYYLYKEKNTSLICSNCGKIDIFKYLKEE